MRITLLDSQGLQEDAKAAIPNMQRYKPEDILTLAMDVDIVSGPRGYERIEIAISQTDWTNSLRQLLFECLGLDPKTYSEQEGHSIGRLNCTRDTLTDLDGKRATNIDLLCFRPDKDTWYGEKGILALPAVNFEVLDWRPSGQINLRGDATRKNMQVALTLAAYKHMSGWNVRLNRPRFIRLLMAHVATDGKNWENFVYSSIFNYGWEQAQAAASARDQEWRCAVGELQQTLYEIAGELELSRASTRSDHAQWAREFLEHICAHFQNNCNLVDPQHPLRRIKQDKHGGFCMVVPWALQNPKPGKLHSPSTQRPAVSSDTAGRFRLAQFFRKIIL